MALGEDYRSLGFYVHWGGNGCSKICKEKRVRIRQLFHDVLRISLCNAAAEVGAHHTAAWDFVRNEFKRSGKHKNEIRTPCKRRRKTLGASNKLMRNFNEGCFNACAILI